MDNFDYKKYLSEGKLLKEEEVTENRFLEASMEDLEQVIRNLAHTGEMSEDEALELAIKKLESMLDGRDDLDDVEVKETKNTSTIYEKEVNGRYGLKYSSEITKGTDADFPYQISVSGGNAEGDNGSFSGFEATEEDAKNRAEAKLKELAKYGTFSKEDQMRIKAGLKK